MAKDIESYDFVEIKNCNMCKESISQSKTLGNRLNVSQGRSPKKLKYGIGVIILRCNNCGLIYSNPKPMPKSINNHYNIEPDLYTKKWSDDNTKDKNLYFQNEISLFKSLVNFKPGMKALDIGMGIGQTVRSLSKNEFDVFGIEPSPSFYKKAIEHLSNKKGQFQNIGIEDVKFPKEYFDFITFGAVLEHLYDPSLALSKSIKWLKPNGIIHIEVPNSNHLVSKIINFYYICIGSNLVTNISPMHNPFHLHEFSLETFNKNGKINNYHVKLSKFDVCSIYNIPKIFHPILRSIMKITKTGLQLTVYLKRN